MNRMMLAATTAAALAGGVALAQTPPQPPGPEASPPRMGWEEGRGMHRHGGPPPFMRMMQDASKAARFTIHRGDNLVNIKCAADEPMKACVEAATALLDKLGSLPAR